MEINKEIASLTEDLGELYNAQQSLLLKLGVNDDRGMKEAQQQIKNMEINLEKHKQQESEWVTHRDTTMASYKEVAVQISNEDVQAIASERKELRFTTIQEGRKTLQGMYG